MSVSATWYLTLAAVLFTIGAVGLLVRRNVLVMFMCVELMLNAANLTFVTFARRLNDIAGQTAVFFVLVVAAAEVVVGLGIIVSIYRRRPGATADDLHGLKADRSHAPRRVPHSVAPSGGFVILLLSGRKLGNPLAGWLATIMVAASFVVTVVVFAGLFRLPAVAARTPRTGSPGSQLVTCTSTWAFSSTHCR